MLQSMLVEIATTVELVTGRAAAQTVTIFDILVLSSGRTMLLAAIGGKIPEERHGRENAQMRETTLEV